MCDPLTLGTLAIGAAGTAANSIGQMNAQKKQESEYNAWTKQQSQARNAENQRQTQLREKAELSRQQGVEDIAADSQAKAQSEEADRLAAMMQGEGEVKPTADPAAPASIADERLTGTESGGEVFQSDLAAQLSNAAKSAKQRITALANVNSYGDSWGGLGTRNPLAFAESGRGIDESNNARKGSMGAYSAEQAIDPTQISYSNPLADIASSFLGVGLQGAGASAAGGGSLGSMFSGALGKGKTSSLFPAAPIAKKFIGPAKPLPAGYGTGLF